MRFIWAAMTLYAAQWYALPYLSDQWAFLLGTSYLAVALLVSGIFSLLETRSLFTASILALWSLDAWADFLKFILWNYSDAAIDLSIPLALVFACWMLFIVRRRYTFKNDEFSTENVFLLIKKPENCAETLKSIFGSPAASLCVTAYGKVWSFRHKTNRFEVFDINPSFLAKHLAVNTGKAANLELVKLLTGLVGLPRGLGYKCIWAIRDPLNSIGGKYSIKSWFDYIPGFYVMRILP